MKTREQKRIEGDERNAAWRELSIQTQLGILARRRGNSKRQVAKLTEKLHETQNTRSAR